MPVNNYIDLPVGSGIGGGVVSLNGEVGAISLVAGPHVTISNSSPTTITISTKGELSQALTQNHIFVGNASNIAQDVPMTGDVGIVFSGGNGVTTVATVGGSSAANINTATSLVNGAQSGNKVLASPANG